VDLQKKTKEISNRACLKAAEYLTSQQGAVTDAVEIAIRELEDEESLNAGIRINS
jgi:isoaspartyl peptidase/L-asparaginase-like protein (Ntn-hydrolase superfamily)